LNEVYDTSIFKTGRPARYRRSWPRLPCSRSGSPRSGLSRSDFVVCWACSVAWRWKSSTQP